MRCINPTLKTTVTGLEIGVYKVTGENRAQAKGGLINPLYTAV
jgi:hypothetical protein